MIVHSACLKRLSGPLSDMAKYRRVLTSSASYNFRLQSRSCQGVFNESFDDAVHSQADFAGRLVNGDPGWDCQGGFGCRIYLRLIHGGDKLATSRICRRNPGL